MNILLTNDDGYGSIGLESLYEELASLGRVFIAAPSQEKSATSHAITIRNSLKIKWFDENRISVSGFPADCVNFVHLSDVFPKFDLVVSGINHGPNLGQDVIYSGTVAGARQGVLSGIDSLAVSLGGRDGKDSDYKFAAKIVRKFIQKIKGRNSEPGVPEQGLQINQKPFFYNINFPPEPGQGIEGIKFTRLGKRKYGDNYRVLRSRQLENENERIKKINENGRFPTEVFMEGEVFHEDEEGDTDINAVIGRHVSVTPLALDQTDLKQLEKSISVNLANIVWR